MAVRADDMRMVDVGPGAVDLVGDRALVERYQAGDERAFDELYNRYSERLRCFCQRKVGDRHAAEEIAQDAFVKALTALPRFAGEMRFYPWLSVIASRLCVDHFRRHGRVSPSDDVDPGVVDEDLGRDLVHQVELADLDAALGRITQRHRTVLELREHRGLSYAEIAADLEVPQTTVETLLFRARKALRREYLAVSGEPGRLAGVPVLGWLGARLRSLRLDLAASRPELAGLVAPVAAGAAAVALTAGVVLGAGAGSGAVEAVEVRPSSLPALVGAPTQTTAAGAPVPTVAAPVPSPTATPATAAPGPSQVTQRGGPVRGPGPSTVEVAPGATVSDDPGAFDDAGDMPFGADTGEATVGADPVAAVDAVLTELFGGNP